MRLIYAHALPLKKIRGMVGTAGKWMVVAFALLYVTTSAVYGQMLMTPADVEKILGKPDWVVLDCRQKKL